MTARDGLSDAMDTSGHSQLREPNMLRHLYFA